MATSTDTNENKHRVSSAVLGEQFGACKILNGKMVALELRSQLQDNVAKWVAEGRRAPGLVIILVGDRVDSMMYVRMKKRAAEKIGIKFTLKQLSLGVTEAELVTVVTELNKDANVDGILVQLPLPEHVQEDVVINAIAADKDVDGLTLTNVARTALGKNEIFKPCTPGGIIHLIRKELPNFEFCGKRATVVGRSDLVGLPMALMLQRLDCTVTICHSKSTESVTRTSVREADIVVVAVGRPKFVKTQWVKPGAIVIDVGITSVEDPGSKKGYVIVGDVDPLVAEVAGALTPVPGGVGPMTIAQLMLNTLKSYCRTSPRGELSLLINV